MDTAIESLEQADDLALADELQQCYAKARSELGKLIIGEASLKNLSGPITIAKYAGVSARIGLEQFFSFLAIISISLGVLNLLPIPMLDGGHLFYYFVEVFKGSPVSEQTEIIGQKIGILLLFCLMSIAIYNDLLRLVE